MIKFEVLIDDIFSIVTNDATLSPIENKKVFSLVNDFEDGKWRHQRFLNFIWNNIKETALSYKERQSLALEGEDSVLTQAAVNLRLSDSDTDFGKGSEIAEIVLYGLMRSYYNAIPIVPKIFYKQNNNDNAKGADSVHIVIESETDFSLWFGESKFYNSIEDARLGTIINSVKESLTLKKLRKENAIITSLSDIYEYEEISESLRTRIVETLSQEKSIDTIKPILNIPILLLYECQITKEASELSDEYKQKVIEHQKDRATSYFKKQLKIAPEVHMYSQINFHIILFPVPEKEPIVKKFIAKAELYREE